MMWALGRVQSDAATCETKVSPKLSTLQIDRLTANEIWRSIVERTTLNWVGICTTTWRRKLRRSYGDLRVCRKLEIALPFLPSSAWPCAFCKLPASEFWVLINWFSSSCTPTEAQSDHHLHRDLFRKLRVGWNLEMDQLHRSRRFAPKWRSRFPSSIEASDRTCASGSSFAKLSEKGSLVCRRSNELSANIGQRILGADEILFASFELPHADWSSINWVTVHTDICCNNLEKEKTE
jgi:hypothetical protein